MSIMKLLLVFTCFLGYSRCVSINDMETFNHQENDLEEENINEPEPDDDDEENIFQTLGCFKDKEDDPDLPYFVGTLSPLPVEFSECAQWCFDLDYRYAGLRFQSSPTACYCGNKYGSQAESCNLEGIENTVIDTGLGVDCGVSEVTPNIFTRIIGGREAAPHSWPWMALFSGMCGAVVISPRYLLTAGHCADLSGDPTLINHLKVSLGIHERSQTSKNNTIHIEHVIMHPNYTMKKEENLFPHYVDLAIIQTKTPIQYNNLVRPICLSRNDRQINENDLCYVTGWGATTPTKHKLITDFKDCSQTPCQNGGECENLFNKIHLCFCPDEYFGMFCETERGKCDPNPCLNGGTCESNETTSWCNCESVQARGEQCEFTTKKPHSATLQQFRVRPVETNNCVWFNRTDTNLVGLIRKNFICAKGYGRKNINRGDSGGPLMCLKEGKWRLYGIVSSFGLQSASSFARIGNVLGWIQTTTGVVLQPYN